MMEPVLKILILEDSPEDAEIVKRVLLKEKPLFEFNLAIDRETYLHALEQFQPDIILSDHSLPQFDSASALNIARQKCPGIPFIMVTGAVSEEFAADIIKLGADDYILKDRLNRLPSAIESVLKQRKTEKEKSQTDQKIIESENNLRAIFENSSEGFLLMDKHGIVKVLNRKMEEFIFWGGGKQIQVGELIYDFMEESRNVGFRVVIEKVLEGDTIEYDRSYEMKNGQVNWVDFCVTPVVDMGKISGVCITGRNITERKKVEQALLQSELRLNEAQAITHISNWEIDLMNDMHIWSDELYRIFELNKEDVTPSVELFLSFIHPEDTELAKTMIADSLRNCTNCKVDFRFILANGEKRYGHMEWRFSFDAAGKPFRLFGILQDITERSEAEERLKLLEQKIMLQKIEEQKTIARAILTGQEKERNFIGQELHDNINQILAGSKMFLSTAAKKDERVKELIKYPVELIDLSIEEIRQLSQKLVVPQKSIPLNELVDGLLDMLRVHTSVNVSLTYDIPDATIADDLKLNIYRIIQEQLNNIQKYAEAKNVEIIMRIKDDFISVTIADDGKGFDTNTKRMGIGISNIINRAECFSGTVSIKSSAGKGCEIKVKIPYGNLPNDAE